MMHPNNLYALIIVIPYLLIMNRYIKNINALRLVSIPLAYLRSIIIYGLLGLIFLVIGITEPIIPAYKKTTIIRNSTIVFVLDVSNSMTMKGSKTTALDDAKAYITKVLSFQETIQSSSCFYSLIAFKGKATVLVPAVQETGYIIDALAWVQPASISGAGSALADALILAKSAIHNPESSILVICTDGNSSSADRELIDLYVLGTETYIVGFGSVSPSVVYNSEGNIIKDAAGKPIQLARNRPQLMLWAQKAHAHYCDFEDSEKFEMLLKKMVALKKSQGLAIAQEKPLRLTPFIALLAYCLFAVAYISYLLMHKQYMELICAND